MAKITVNTPRPTTRSTAWAAAESTTIISTAPVAHEIPLKISKHLPEREGVLFHPNHGVTNLVLEKRGVETPLPGQ